LSIYSVVMIIMCCERTCWRSVSAIRVWGPEGCF